MEHPGQLETHPTWPYSRRTCDDQPAFHPHETRHCPGQTHSRNDWTKRQRLPRSAYLPNPIEDPAFPYELTGLASSGRNRIPQSVATYDCRRDTVLGGAVASRVPHPQTGDGYCLGTVESHRATRRCRTSPGTASPDAVPQIRACRSHSPRVGQRPLSRHSYDTLLCESFEMSSEIVLCGEFDLKADV